MTKNPLILASASPRRLQLLANIGVTPDQVIPANIDESSLKAEKPHLYAARIAKIKAAHVASQYPDAIILAADTVVACGARILPKAEDAQTARQYLQLLSGKRHRVYTSVVVQKNTRMLSKTVMTVVQFSRLTPKQIEEYVASGEWEGKAGGYAIQGLAQRFIPRINGSPSNVIGLPLKETVVMLEAI